MSEAMAKKIIRSARGPAGPPGEGVRLSKKCKCCKLALDHPCPDCGKSHADLPGAQEVFAEIGQMLRSLWDHRVIFEAVAPAMSEWPECARMSSSSIARHTEHLSVGDGLLRMITQVERAKNEAAAESWGGVFVDVGAALMALLARGVQDIANGKIVITSIKELLEVCKFWMEYQARSDEEMNWGEARARWGMLVAAIEAVLNDEEKSRVGAKLAEQSRKTVLAGEWGKNIAGAVRAREGIPEKAALEPAEDEEEDARREAAEAGIFWDE